MTPIFLPKVENSRVWSCSLCLKIANTPTLIAQLMCCHGNRPAQCACKWEEWRREELEEEARVGRCRGRRNANFMATSALCPVLALANLPRKLLSWKKVRGEEREQVRQRRSCERYHLSVRLSMCTITRQSPQPVAGSLLVLTRIVTIWSSR